MTINGTAVIIEEDKMTIGPEFKEEMYPNKYGNEFSESLSKVTNIKEFDKMNVKFNKDNFGQDLMDNEVTKIADSNAVSLINIYNETDSDWIFVKNLTSDSIEVEIYDEIKIPKKDTNFKRKTKIESGEVLRVHRGIYVNDGMGHRIKTKK